MSEFEAMKEWVLSLPLETKISMFRDAVKERNFSAELALSKLFLNTPLDKGGVQTEILEAIRKEFN